MDHSAASLAVTGRNQRVEFCFLVAETNLAVSLPLLNSLIVVGLMLFYLKNSIRFFKMVSVPQRKGVVLVFGLNYHVLNSSQLDNVSRP
jgi:uncharacterized membrane protein YciS (DUF1049 family)